MADVRIAEGIARKVILVLKVAADNVGKNIRDNDVTFSHIYFPREDGGSSRGWDGEEASFILTLPDRRKYITTLLLLKKWHAEAASLP